MEQNQLTAEELQGMLTEILGPAGKSEVSRDTPTSRLSGFVAHPEFRGLGLDERRKRVFDQLRVQLGERTAEIGILLFLSPEEYQETFGEPLEAA